MDTLKSYGWNEHFEHNYRAAASEQTLAARIVAEYQKIYRVITVQGEYLARIAGKIRHSARSISDFPTAGDWVVVSKPSCAADDTVLITSILSRLSAFSRQHPEREGEEQVVAANVDYVFIVQGLDNDFNLRRLERYIVMSVKSGAAPVVILNKTDVCPDVHERIMQARAVAGDVPVHAICSLTESGYDQVYNYIAPGKTVALIGSSGVGKSTIINNLLCDDVQEVQDVRETDARGRHTTTTKELFLLDGGGVLLDTPGMRELQLWDAEESLEDAFDDIETLALQCRFRGCRHDAEPDCAVKQALEEGGISQSRLNNYRRLQSERDHDTHRQKRRTFKQRKRFS